MSEKRSCENCKLKHPYDPEDPDASICIYYDCFAPDFKDFQPRPDGEKR